MSVFTKIFGVLLAIAGIVTGIWVDIWLLLVGGIKMIVAGVTTDPVNGSDIAWGIVRVLCTGVGGTISVVAIIAGVSLALYGSTRRRR